GSATCDCCAGTTTANDTTTTLKPAPHSHRSGGTEAEHIRCYVFRPRARTRMSVPNRASCVLASEEAVERMPFVTSHTSISVDGFETALAEAAKHADDRPIDIAGGASAVRQTLQARCLNELVLDIVPVLLRDGERIFEDVPEFHAEAAEAATSPLATHIVYKIT